MLFCFSHIKYTYLRIIFYLKSISGKKSTKSTKDNKTIKMFIFVLFLLHIITGVSAVSPVVVSEKAANDDANSDYTISVTCNHPQLKNGQDKTYVVWYTSESYSSDPNMPNPCATVGSSTSTSCTASGAGGHFKATDCPVRAAETANRVGTIHFDKADVTFYVHQALCEKTDWYTGTSSQTILYEGPLPLDMPHTRGFRAFRRATIVVDSSDFTGKSNKFGDVKKIKLIFTDPDQLLTVTIAMRLESAPLVTKYDNVLATGNAVVVGTTTSTIDNIAVSIPPRCVRLLLVFLFLSFYLLSYFSFFSFHFSPSFLFFPQPASWYISHLRPIDK